MDEGFDGDHQDIKPLTASQARSKTTKTTQKRSKDINYNLTLRRLYRIIKNATENGCEEITFKAPSFVLDGCIGDPIILARQLKARFVELGYSVRRQNDTLLIKWGQDAEGPSLKSARTTKKKKPKY